MRLNSRNFSFSMASRSILFGVASPFLSSLCSFDWFSRWLLSLSFVAVGVGLVMLVLLLRRLVRFLWILVDNGSFSSLPFAQFFFAAFRIILRGVWCVPVDTLDVRHSGNWCISSSWLILLTLLPSHTVESRRN